MDSYDIGRLISNATFCDKFEMKDFEVHNYPILEEIEIRVVLKPSHTDEA